MTDKKAPKKPVKKKAPSKKRTAPALSKEAKELLSSDDSIAKSLAGLTPKQANFVVEYLVDTNATQAAIRAGYTDNAVTAGAIGSENLKKPLIKSAIEAQMIYRARRTMITADYVLNGLMSVYERCMQAEQVTELVDGVATDTGEFKFEHSGANKSLETMAKHLGMLKDKVEHSTGEGVSFNMGFGSPDAD